MSQRGTGVNLFFDTSALVKYFYPEIGTKQVTTLIQDKTNAIWVSELARLEFYSAIFRRYRAKQLDEKQLTIVLTNFDKTLTKFHVEPLVELITNEAERLLKKYAKNEGLRTLDALHLASFSLLAEIEWYFVGADAILCDIAKYEGFQTITIQKVD